MPVRTVLRMPPMAPTPALIVAGPAGVGKTAVRRELERLLPAARSLGPDDFDGDWIALMREYHAADFAIVECVRLNRLLRRRLDRAVVTVLHAPPGIRALRLIEQGHSEDEASRRAGQPWNIAYGEPVPIDLTFDTTEAAPADLAAQIVRSPAWERRQIAEQRSTLRVPSG